MSITGSQLQARPSVLRLMFAPKGLILAFAHQRPREAWLLVRTRGRLHAMGEEEEEIASASSLAGVSRLLPLPASLPPALSCSSLTPAEITSASSLAGASCLLLLPAASPLPYLAPHSRLRS